MTQPQPTVATFEAWMEAANPCDQFLYHTGEHLKGTRLINAVRDAYNRGIITLTQRRLDSHPNGGEFEFIAIKLQHRARIASHGILPVESSRGI